MEEFGRVAQWNWTSASSSGFGLPARMRDRAVGAMAGMRIPESLRSLVAEEAGEGELPHACDGRDDRHDEAADFRSSQLEAARGE